MLVAANGQKEQQKVMLYYFMLPLGISFIGKWEIIIRGALEHTPITEEPPSGNGGGGGLLTLFLVLPATPHICIQEFHEFWPKRNSTNQ